MAQHRDRRAGRRLVLGLGEVPPERRRRVEEAEKARAHGADAHLACGLSDTDRKVAGSMTCHARERVRPLREVEMPRVLTAGGGTFRTAERLESIDAVHHLRVSHQRRRPKEQPVHDAEHRGVSADAEPERRHHRDRKPWLGAQATMGRATIVSAVSDSCRAAGRRSDSLTRCAACGGQSSKLAVQYSP